MDDMIPVVNKLQDVFSAIGQDSIDLPQIVVVGSQSSGKSSVLESLVGRDFLPRGSGIVTRRPLVLQLYSLSDKTCLEEWGEFLHLPGKKFFDFNEIRNEIINETERETGKNKGISTKSINLKIFSPHVLPLTLVDLPGITKIPLGDQPEDIEEQIRTMCLQFIRNPNAIILAVTAANQDLSNSDGLQLSRFVDPEGIRTVGVLTKVDIMDQGTDVVDVLTNKLFPLRRGYVAVINRSQRDIQENVTVQQGLEKEQIYFHSHPRYKNYATNCGTKMLARILSQMLMYHIRDCLPSIKSRIALLLTEVQNNLDDLGEQFDDRNVNRKGETLLRLISNFSRNITSYIDGGKGVTLGVRELCGGARIGYVFNEIFTKRLSEINALEGILDSDICIAMSNANGVRHPLFIPEASFDLLVRKQIAKLEEPGLQCLDLVYDEMIRMCLQSDTNEINRFPLLRDRLFEVVNSLLRNCLKPAQAMISNLIKVELAHINTSHPDFIGGKKAILSLQKGNSANDAASNSPHDSSLNADLSVDKEIKTEKNVTIRQQSKPQMTSDINLQTATTNIAPMTGFLNIFRGSSGLQDDNSHRGDNLIDDGRIRLKQVPEKMRSSHLNLTNTEKVEIKIIKALITSYFDVVKKSYMDLVPKIIMHFLVNSFKESLQNELVSNLYRDQILSELMRETADIAEKRTRCIEMKEFLNKAMEIVNEVRDFNILTK